MKTQIISFFKESNIEVPDSENEIINLLLGALVVGKIDYWIERIGQSDWMAMICKERRTKIATYTMTYTNGSDCSGKRQHQMT